MFISTSREIHGEELVRSWDKHGLFHNHSGWERALLSFPVSNGSRQLHPAIRDISSYCVTQKCSSVCSCFPGKHMEKSKITLRNITWRAGESIKTLATISLTTSFPGLFGTSVLDKSVHAHEKNIQIPPSWICSAACHELGMLVGHAHGSWGLKEAKALQTPLGWSRKVGGKVKRNLHL